MALIPLSTSRVMPVLSEAAQPTTHSSRQGQLTVTESPGPTEATDQITWLAGNAVAVAVPCRTLAAINISPLLDKQSIQAGSLDQFQSSEDTCRSASDYDDVVFFYHSIFGSILIVL